MPPLPSKKSRLPGQTEIRGFFRRLAPYPGRASPGRPRPAHVDAPNATVVYTDGSCLGNGQEGAAAGAGVFWGADDPRNRSVRVPGACQTNQRAELYAVLLAMEEARTLAGVLEVRTDSRYVISCMTEWIVGWRQRGWVTSQGAPVKHQDLLTRMETLLGARTERVCWVHVAAHCGEPGNEAADRLAAQGARLQPESGCQE